MNDAKKMTVILVKTYVFYVRTLQSNVIKKNAIKQ